GRGDFIGDLAQTLMQVSLLVTAQLSGREPLAQLLVRKVGRHAVMNVASSVLRLTGDDREGDVPRLAIIGLPRRRETRSVEQTAVLRVDVVGLLRAVVLLDPLV